MQKLDVLAIAAHPDDTELCCSGTLAVLARQGRNVGVADLTKGEMGTRGTPEGRLQEASDAAGILGLTMRENLGLPDTRLDNTPENREAIIRLVRTWRPDVCLINSPDDRHPDHRNASRLTIDALFYSGLKKISTTGDDGKEQEPWRPHHILHYMQDKTFEPSIVFDITETMHLKEKAILAFKSQFNVAEHDPEPQTYISGNRFFEMIKGRARHYGHMIGAEFGEPFLYYNGPLPFSNFDLLLNSRPKR
ncbi:MAG: bacillithiol biosynthesis deacetylase BshB1 [Balneolaceae bacterium]|nr:MAG: bacillithiol biosynthesis deacetylase BshB1 [Balneolaceae bacterium]